MKTTATSAFLNFPPETYQAMSMRLKVVNARIKEILSTDLYSNWMEYLSLVQERNCLKENVL